MPLNRKKNRRRSQPDLLTLFSSNGIHSGSASRRGVWCRRPAQAQLFPLSLRIPVHAAKIKTPPENRWCNYSNGKSDSSLDLIGTEASGTCVNMAGSSIHDSLDTLNIGLPCTVSPSVGVGDLDTKGYALTTKIALSHFIAPPIRMISSTNYANIRRLDMIPDNP